MRKLMLKAILVVAFLFCFATPAKGQFALYSWTDTTTVTTNVTTLTASVVYQQLTIYSDTVDVLIKWNNAQTYILLKSGASFSFGASDKIQTLYLKAQAGTGLVYTAGLKTSKQTSVGF